MSKTGMEEDVESITHRYRSPKFGAGESTSRSGRLRRELNVNYLFDVDYLFVFYWSENGESYSRGSPYHPRYPRLIRTDSRIMDERSICPLKGGGGADGLDENISMGDKLCRV